nr:hypothetical protein Iba_chr15aCG12950 [Ipomoea batatas]GMD95506.1 hypothetical protein Iba_chr15aCG12960 [Ipomoea batatas]
MITHHRHYRRCYAAPSVAAVSSREERDIIRSLLMEDSTATPVYGHRSFTCCQRRAILHRNGKTMEGEWEG